MELPGANSLSREQQPLPVPTGQEKFDPTALLMWENKDNFVTHKANCSPVTQKPQVFVAAFGADCVSVFL